MKLQAGTLAYALAISLIIGMITASVLLNEHYSRLLIHRDEIREEVVRNANSGIVYLCGKSPVETNFTEKIDLFARGKDSVTIQCKSWGVYDILISKSKTGNENFKRMALAGSVIDPVNRYALWIGDMDRPLKVCGKTELKGKCFLPKAGIERTYIEGKSFAGRELVQGTILPSSRFIPKYNEQRYGELEKLFSGDVQSDDSTITWTELSAQDSVFCTFDGPVCMVSEKIPLVISNIYLEGQIRIHSSVSILVAHSATLINVVLVAPEIRIESETEGCFQSIARDSIILGKNVVLNFPSSLCLCSTNASPLQTSITMDENCSISGDVFAVLNGELHQRRMLVDIPKGCSIYGNVYCNANVDLQGSVIGSLTCQNISLTTNSAVYENTLLDAVVDNTQTSSMPPGGSMFGDSNRKEVIVWLR